MHGPKGAGALYVRSGVKLPPLLLGGGQESGKRPGTEVLPAAVGFGVAARLGKMELEETAANARKLRDYISSRLAEELPETVVIGDGDSPFILSLSLPGQKSEVLMSYLDGEGICVSKSAACKKRRAKPDPGGNAPKKRYNRRRTKSKLFKIQHPGRSSNFHKNPKTSIKNVAKKNVKYYRKINDKKKEKRKRIIK
jgi:hypothetical protein